MKRLLQQQDVTFSAHTFSTQTIFALQQVCAATPTLPQVEPGTKPDTKPVTPTVPAEPPYQPSDPKPRPSTPTEPVILPSCQGRSEAMYV